MFNFDCFLFLLFFFLVFGVWQQFDLDMDGNYDTSSHDGLGRKKHQPQLFLPRLTYCTVATHIAPFELYFSIEILRNQAQSCECKDLLGDWQLMIVSQ